MLRCTACTIANRVLVPKPVFIVDYLKYFEIHTYVCICKKRAVYSRLISTKMRP